METIQTVQVGNVIIGGTTPVFIAGPCSIESREHIIEEAKALKAMGVNLLRGGAFKPRTSPHDFQGLGMEAVKYLYEAKEITGLPIVTEVMSEDHIEEMLPYVDMFQVGTRNMYNYALLQKLGKVNKPVLLKRGFSATLREWQMAAEYIIAGGNDQVVFCERGIRTNNDITRNTLDLAGAVMMRQMTHRPVIVDPSHATGVRSLVGPMTMASVAAGLDGVMIEVHEVPDASYSDGAQTIDYDLCRTIIEKAKKI